MLNLIGSVVLTVVALSDSDWGFLLLEAVWAAVSGRSLARLMRGRLPSAAH